MNYRKAKNIIENNYPKTTKMVDGRYQGGFDDHESDFGQALDKACEALKKLIPMEPITKGDDTWCPCCKDVVYDVEGYCPNCGQALDWSDV